MADAFHRVYRGRYGRTHFQGLHLNPAIAADQKPLFAYYYFSLFIWCDPFQLQKFARGYIRIPYRHYVRSALPEIPEYQGPYRRAFRDRYRQPFNGDTFL